MRVGRDASIRNWRRRNVCPNYSLSSEPYFYVVIWELESVENDILCTDYSTMNNLVVNGILKGAGFH